MKTLWKPCFRIIPKYHHQTYPIPLLLWPHLSRKSVVKRVVTSFSPGTAPWPSSLRASHLAEAISCPTPSCAQASLSTLSQFSSLPASGNIPLEVVSHLCGATLLASKKKDGGLRPIAVAETLRCLVSSAWPSRYATRQPPLCSPFKWVLVPKEVLRQLSMLSTWFRMITAFPLMVNGACYWILIMPLTLLTVHTSSVLLVIRWQLCLRGWNAVMGLGPPYCSGTIPFPAVLVFNRETLWALCVSHSPYSLLLRWYRMRCLLSCWISGIWRMGSCTALLWTLRGPFLSLRRRGLLVVWGS